jgi:Protein of unknown function (DUF3037)
VPDPCAYDYALLRVVPHVERGEFVNAGVVVCCTGRQFLKARVDLDEARLLALDSQADVGAVRAGLDAIVRVCEGGPAAGPIGKLPLRARFDWLVAPRSTIIQTSCVHAGRATDPDAALERLLERMVRRPVVANDRTGVGEGSRSP